MVHNSWNLPHLPARDANGEHYRLWGSARLTYTLCAFLSNVLQIALRNMLGVVILRMVKARPEDTLLQEADYHLDRNLTDIPNCGQVVIEQVIQSGDLEWTRNQELTFPGTFYYGYVITLPLAGYLTDRFGGKLLFICSLTLQAVAFIALPLIAPHSYMAAVTTLVLAGIFAGCGTPPLYHLFVIWAHPTERTSMLSFAYSGLIVGSIFIYPLANYLSDISWKVPFFMLGGVTLLFGISCHWLIYNTLDQHPRLADAECVYLQPKEFGQPVQFSVPWRSLLTSMPVYAFVLTHVFHNYGFLFLSLNMPRFMREAMRTNLKQIGFLSSAPFLGSFLSKVICILSCSHIERRMFARLSCLRRILYTICCSVTIILTGFIILASCEQKTLVLVMYFAMGAFTDLGFSAGYWPTLLYFAPSFAGLLSGLANCIAHISGFLAPHLIAALVHSGIKTEWNCALLTIILFNVMGLLVFGLFSSSNLQSWDPRTRKSVAPSSNPNNS